MILDFGDTLAFIFYGLISHHFIIHIRFFSGRNRGIPRPIPPEEDWRHDASSANEKGSSKRSVFHQPRMRINISEEREASD